MEAKETGASRPAEFWFWAARHIAGRGISRARAGAWTLDVPDDAARARGGAGRVAPRAARPSLRGSQTARPDADAGLPAAAHRPAFERKPLSQGDPDRLGRDRSRASGRVAAVLERPRAQLGRLYRTDLHIWRSVSKFGSRQGSGGWANGPHRPRRRKPKPTNVSRHRNGIRIRTSARLRKLYLLASDWLLKQGQADDMDESNGFG